MPKTDAAAASAEMAVRPNKIREQRERSRLTQKELALLVGLDFTTVSKHETGDRGLTPDEVRKYSAVFKIQSYELFL